MQAHNALVIATQEYAPPVYLPLARAGWHVRVANTRHAAVELAGGVRPDVVVVEAWLLGNLAAVIVRQLQLQWGRRLPIIGITPSPPSDFLLAELSLFSILLPPLEAATVLSAANQALRAGQAGQLANPSSASLMRLWHGGRRHDPVASNLSVRRELAGPPQALALAVS